MSIAVGSGIGSTPAKIASANTRTIQPIAAQNSMPKRRPLRAGAETASSARSSSSVAMADPGIEDGVEHIDDEVHNDEAAADQQHHALQNDEIAGEDGTDQQSADPRQGKNSLDDQRTADQPAN